MTRRTAAALAVLLTAAAGATDAIAFTRLGETFASVMTGNLVLLGVAAGRRDAELAVGVAVAVAAFAVGTLAGGRIARAREGVLWPPRVTATLGVEALVLAAVEGLWLTAPVRLLLLGLAAAAMGLQSAAVRAIGISGLSTTYLTGTLVGFLGDLASSGRPPWRSAAILVALVTGGGLAVLLLAVAFPVAPVLPLGLVVVVAVLAVTWSRAERSRRR